MNKITTYLKHFFMLDDDALYHKADYKNYAGPGFRSFKQSLHFIAPRGWRAGYLKSEVAAYSEMTKVMILIGMAILLFVVVWCDVKVAQLLLDPAFRTKQMLALLAPPGYLLNRLAICMYPRAIFLLKNFKLK